MLRLERFVLCLTLAHLAALHAFGQVAGAKTEAGNPDDPLAMRQQIVRDRMAQLEDRMFRLAEKLAPSEPEQAQRLEQALRQARELLIRRNMDETIALLEKAELAAAADRQVSIHEALDRVLKILLTEPDDTKERQKAIEQLKAFQAQIEALLKEQRRLKDESNARPEAAQEQRQLQNKTEKLAGDMQCNNPQGASRPCEGKQGEDKKDNHSPDRQKSPTPPAPGAENVKRSSEHMNDAGDDLERQAQKEAGKDQQKAINELEKARQALGQALKQLQQEEQAEVLRQLAARFRAMLAKQLAVNKQTETLEAKGQAKWNHSDELTLAALTQEETALADDAAEALRILTEDGTSIVFPPVVRQLKEDILAVTRRLGAKKTGAATQQIEADIVTTLEELIEAMKPPPSGGGASGGGGGAGGAAGPLLPNSAELKMLRSCQKRVHRQTAAFHAAHGDPAGWRAAEQGHLERLAGRQQEVAEMARKINERLQSCPLPGADQSCAP